MTDGIKEQQQIKNEGSAVYRQGAAKAEKGLQESWNAWGNKNLADMWSILQLPDFDIDGNEHLGAADIAKLRRLALAIRDDLKGSEKRG